MPERPVLVTGALGFIGSNVTRKLIEAGNPVIVVYSDNDLSNWKYLQGSSIVDFIHYKSLKSIPKGTRSVIHLGAISSTTSNDYDGLIENNFKFTVDLANLCKSSKIRMVYASSAAVYGNNATLPDEDRWDYKPLNLYGQSKLWTDLALRGMKDICGLRYFNVYGPNESHKGSQSSVILKFTREIMETGTVKLFIERHGVKGHAKRDFVHVDDVADITIKLALMDDPIVHPILNVGRGDTITFQRVAELVASTIGQDLKIDWIDMPDNIAEHYQYETHANIYRLLNDGFQKPRSVEEGVPQYVNYLLGKLTFNVGS